MGSLVERYGLARVPRYTSYPTAPHFHDGVDGDTASGWLEALGPDHSLSLYLHVPFCSEMCWYCGCHTKVTRRYTPVAAYVGDLAAEIDLVAELASGAGPVRHVHWGGGSPNRLERADFSRLMERLSERFRFTDDAEVAVEVDPRTFTGEDARAYRDAGVTRVSLGVQTFDPIVQKAINRIQPFEQVAGVFEALRAAGIDRINADLMYGLPQQDMASLDDTVRRIGALKPDRLAVFGYAHVPWMKTHMRLIDEAALPGVHERFEQATRIRDDLVAEGYVAIGLDHFARAHDPMAVAAAEGTLRRNFQGYTTDPADALIGLGASAIGSLPQGYLQNAPDIAGYGRAVSDGRLATVHGTALTDDDRARRNVIEALMCRGRADPGAIAAQHGLAADSLAPDPDRLAELIRDGLAWADGDEVGVTDDGWPFVRMLAALFDTYLQGDQQRHSKAV